VLHILLFPFPCAAAAQQARPRPPLDTHTRAGMPVTRPHAWVWLGVAAAVACVLAAGGLARGDVAGGGARVANGRPDWGGWRGVGPNPAPLLPLSGWVHDGQARPGPAPPLRRPPSPPLPESHPALARTGTRGGGAGAVGTQASVAASPHAPEQVMLSLEGPGAVTVSWVTHPQVSVCVKSGKREEGGGGRGGGRSTSRGLYARARALARAASG